MPGGWSEEDDARLWELHSKRAKPAASEIAAELGNKTQGEVRSRLRQLREARENGRRPRAPRAPRAPREPRRRNEGPSPFGTSSAAAANSAAASMSPFAVGYIAAKAALSSKKRSSAPTQRSSTAAASGGVVDLTGPSPPSAKYYAPGSYVPPANVPPAASSSSSSTKSKRVDPSTLNADQRAASEYIFSGGNAFLTGAAGVGKSYLLNYVIQGLKDRYEPLTSYASKNRDSSSAVVVAAATGIAATHINGVTIHSWSGVRLGKGGAKVLVPRVLQNAAACQRWRKARVLVLDEVSMIDGAFFDALDAIGREVRGCPHRPFGGIQLVLSGDFFQLPPVSLGSCGFAFETPAWSGAAVKMVELRTVVRQSGDDTFINLLNQIRIGKCPMEITDALEACHVSRKALPVDGIVPTKLYCTNRNVDEENNRKLASLPGKAVVFAASDDFKGNYTREVQRSISQTMDKKVPAELRLKVGAQIIITRNMPQHNLVNGSRGVIASFDELGKSEYEGQRKTTGGGRSGRRYPLVHLSNGVRMLVTEESVFQGGSSGAMARSQLPLKLAWSLTVHKSQGMTIERAELQLDDAFDFGQVYVALSRITSLEGLWVRGGRITQGVVKAHPKVKAFYRANGSAVLDG